jgi:magnesium transporter
MGKRRRKRYHPPGTVPGTLAAHAEAGSAPVRMKAFLYDAERFEEREVVLADIPALSPPKKGVLWLDVAGLSDPGVIRAVGDRFGMHPLAQEDVLNVPQRPKVEWYGENLLMVLWQVHFRKPSEQLSFFVSEQVLISFQETREDPFEPVRARIRQGAGRIRGEGADYLLYSLSDAVLDALFPLLERLGDEAEELEERVIVSPVPETFAAIRALKRELLAVRRAVWPARDAMNLLLIEEHALVRPGTKVFLRDCYDHTVQLMDMVNVFREQAAGLVEEYQSAVSNRMNEVMKALTIVASFFIPLTFIVGIYGMNFDPDASPFNMPEVKWRYGYPAVLLLMAAVSVGMFWHFRKKKWL